MILCTFVGKFSKMRKVHLISVTEPILSELALAIHRKGYEVSVSGIGLSDDDIKGYEAEGCTCYGNGWFPEKITKDIQFIVLGSQVRAENPELIRAKELGLYVVSIPEFIYERTKSKIRVVVAGSKGKKTILTMIVAALRRQRMAFDYAMTSRSPLLPNRIHLSYEARIALIEGDEHVTSALEKRFQLEFFRPHIAIITNLLWTSATDHQSPEAYHSTFRTFASSIEREGKLIYYDGDPMVKELATQVREDITALPYDQHEVIEKDGKTFLHTRYGDYQICIPDRFFLINLNAARLACRQLGIMDSDFYQAMSDYSLSLGL